MTKIIKQLIKNLVTRTIFFFGKTKIGSFLHSKILNSAMEATQTLTHLKTTLTFSIPNQLNIFRVNTFSTKEPETLEWIDSIPQGSVLWDVGANVGLYSCYAAKSRHITVYAFEPSVFNLELLARNIYINNLVDRVIIIPLALTDSLKISTLNMTSTHWGGALSTFGEDYGDDGRYLLKTFEFSSVGVSMDDVAASLNIPYPDYIKMDVDGLEHQILSGGSTVLKKVSGLSIEVNEEFTEQAINVAKFCTQAGLVFKEKRHSAMIDGNERFAKTYNQIWFRPKLSG